MQVTLGTAGIKSVIWATGYRPDYRWLDLPVFDRQGMPRHEGGVAAMPGLYFMGLPFMRRRKSSFICGTGDDARDICHHLLAHLGRPVGWYCSNFLTQGMAQPASGQYAGQSL